jgi:hypothetical protein
MNATRVATHISDVLLLVDLYLKIIDLGCAKSMTVTSRQSKQTTGVVGIGTVLSKAALMLQSIVERGYCCVYFADVISYLFN